MSDTEHIHEWFGLSYASYLVVNRSVLQSMPDEWQERFVRCLNEMNEHFGDSIPWPSYAVMVRDETTGRYTKDPIPHYWRGRTFLPGKAAAS